MAAIRQVELGTWIFWVKVPWRLVMQFTAEIARLEANQSLTEAQKTMWCDKAAFRFLRRAIVRAYAADANGRPKRRVWWIGRLLAGMDASDVAALLQKILAPPEELVAKKKREWLAIVRAYAAGRRVFNPPAALVMDMLLCRYPGYTAQSLLEEEAGIVAALADIALAAADAEETA